MLQIAKNEVFGHFLEFGLSAQLDIAQSDRNECSETFCAHAGSFKNVENLILNDPMSQNDIFVHYYEFCLPNQLDIATFDRNECSKILGNVARS